MNMETEASSHPDPKAEREAELAQLEDAVESGASWFYWIAGLSVANSLIQLVQSDWSFIFGLGITQIVDAIAAAFTEGETGSGPIIVKAVALCFSLLAAGIFAVFGWLANRHKAWAFVLGMTLYALDGVLFLFVQDWLGLAVHGLALILIFSGYSALRKLRAAQAEADALTRQDTIGSTDPYSAQGYSPSYPGAEPSPSEQAGPKREKIMKRILIAGCGVMVLGVIGLAGLGFWWYQEGMKPLEGIEIEVEAPSSLHQGDELELLVKVRNLREVPIEKPEIVIDNAFHDAFSIVEVSPQPTMQHEFELAVIVMYTFDLEIPPGEEQVFTFKGQAEQEGLAQGEVMVGTESSRRSVTAMISTEILPAEPSDEEAQEEPSDDPAQG